MIFDLNNITRPSVKNLKPYSSARDEFTGKAEVYLDANENPFDTGLNRYPDPYQQKLKNKISKIKNIDARNIILGNGSDEVIDLLFRAFCEPGEDEVIIHPPTYGMYQVCADVNNVKTNKVPLTSDFELDETKLFEAINKKSKIIWFCSPNNPTGNTLDPTSIKNTLNSFNGIVVIDEAYIDFSDSQSWIDFLDFYPNLFIIQTLSKAWGLAGLRLGMGFASAEIISVLNKIKPPYNVNSLTQEKAIESLGYLDEKNETVDVILNEKNSLINDLSNIPTVEKIYPSDTNFILVKINDATNIYNKLVEQSIIVRNRSNVKLCEECLRITVGKSEENNKLIEAIKEIIK
ncbi:MAG: histidinol-phosphate transaminase [Flavobacteriales bacterium]|nr:histidinol-phosphate transaminase [Flavobacteriales bacterium]|tara:strand:+ start:40224 stop:41264 length:1041 start_codon:yes stop_codon:yes gene_type:complete